MAFYQNTFLCAKLFLLGMNGTNAPKLDNNWSQLFGRYKLQFFDAARTSSEPSSRILCDSCSSRPTYMHKDIGPPRMCQSAFSDARYLPDYHLKPAYKEYIYIHIYIHVGMGVGVCMRLLRYLSCMCE